MVWIAMQDNFNLRVSVPTDGCTICARWNDERKLSAGVHIILWYGRAVYQRGRKARCDAHVC